MLQEPARSARTTPPGNADHAERPMLAWEAHDRPLSIESLGGQIRRLAVLAAAQHRLAAIQEGGRR